MFFVFEFSKMSSAAPRPKPSSSTKQDQKTAGRSLGTKQVKSSKKPKALPILVAVKPLNLDKEKKAFFDAKGKYDPQFVYSSEVDEKSMTQYGEASNRYLAQVTLLCIV